MMYLAWAAFFEGNSDYDYFEVLIPRVIEEMLGAYGLRPVTVPPAAAIRLGRNGREISAVAKEICETRDAFHLLIVHADAGGRAHEASLPERSKGYCEEANRICDFPVERCVSMSPRHEMEAWAISDPDAVLSALGYRGSADDLNLPKDGDAAERTQDPKAVLKEAATRVRGRRRRGRAEIPFAAIAQRQSLSSLRSCASFRQFENNLHTALATLGCVAMIGK